MTKKDNIEDSDQAGEGASARASRNRTTPDRQSARVGGQTTLLSGISGASLSYLPGDIVDGAYQLTKLLGRGGMGAVFACRHIVLGKEYALKLLSGEQLSGPAWARFQIEAKSLAMLNHPGIVGIYNMGIDKEQCPYYVMDLLSGEAMDSLIDRSGSLPVAEALKIFIQVADALASAHAQGIIHRDIKPSNLMLMQDEQKQITTVKLVDFGIARLSKQGLAAQSQTATGLIFGNPFYMSPEQCQGARVDERSDVYSLGCTLFEALTGEPPFVGDSAFHTFLLHQTGEIPSLASRAPRKDFPQSLELAVDKMLSKSPADRYQSMTKVKHDLERIKAGKPIMAEGLSNTIAPADKGTEQGLSRQRFDAPRGRPSEKYVDPVNEAPWADNEGQSTLKKLAMVLCVLLVIGGGWAIQNIWPSHSSKSVETKKPRMVEPEKDKQVIGDEELLNIVTPSKHPKDDKLVIAPLDKLRSFGATAEELDLLSNDKFTQLSIDEDTGRKMLITHEKSHVWAKAKFKSDGYFHFPEDIFIGSISIDNARPILAKGAIAAPGDKDIFLYLITPTKVCPKLLNKFGPDDLTGLAMVFEKPSEAIEIISKWKRLKDLMFFNPILKAMPNSSETWDESRITDAELPSLEKFTGLHSLGLCNAVTGPAILKLALLRKIEAIKLKRIHDFEPLLVELPRLTNLKEVFLMHQETSDEQLKILARMKNLQKLTVLRSNLTLGSLKYFQQMKALKELRLDRNDWTVAQKADFQSQLPHCTVSYEKVSDCDFWPIFPD